MLASGIRSSLGLDPVNAMNSSISILESKSATVLSIPGRCCRERVKLFCAAFINMLRINVMILGDEEEYLDQDWVIGRLSVNMVIRLFLNYSV